MFVRTQFDRHKASKLNGDVFHQSCCFCQELSASSFNIFPPSIAWMLIFMTVCLVPHQHFLKCQLFNMKLPLEEESGLMTREGQIYQNFSWIPPNYTEFSLTTFLQAISPNAFFLYVIFLNVCILCTLSPNIHILKTLFNEVLDFRGVWIMKNSCIFIYTLHIVLISTTYGVLH